MRTIESYFVRLFFLCLYVTNVFFFWVVQKNQWRMRESAGPPDSGWEKNPFSHLRPTKSSTHLRPPNMIFFLVIINDGVSVCVSMCLCVSVCLSVCLRVYMFGMVSVAGVV